MNEKEFYIETIKKFKTVDGVSLNRNILECKGARYALYESTAIGLNRNILECKGKISF